MALVWAVHAGVDWDWEMPAVTLWLFALAGLGLGAPIDRNRSIVAPKRIVRIVVAIGIGVLAITPGAIAVSQNRLDNAIAAFERNECGPAISDALGSLSALKVRPAPYEILGYCDARLGQYQLAEAAMSNASNRDPDSWETHYGQAIVAAAAGKNPMPELREARRLNPLEPTILEAIDAMRGASPKQRERRAASARLPL
jgi:tetratricopeptide (TPR) repeat protein